MKNKKQHTTCTFSQLDVFGAPRTNSLFITSILNGFKPQNLNNNLPTYVTQKKANATYTNYFEN